MNRLVNCIARNRVVPVNIAFLSVLMAACASFAQITVHFLSPWADERPEEEIYIISSETGWYPGTSMEYEGGGWYSYTLNQLTTDSEQRIEFLSTAPRRQDHTYQGGEEQMILQDIFAQHPTAQDVWIRVPDPDSLPVFEFVPPPSKTLFFLTPWDIGNPRVLMPDSSIESMKLETEYCGWFSYTFFDEATENIQVRFFNPADSSFYSLAGLQDGAYIDLRVQFETSDTVWLFASPDNQEPVSQAVFPEITGECGFIYLGATLRDISMLHPDFELSTMVDDDGNEPQCLDHFAGYIEDRLGPTGKPVALEPVNRCFSSLDDWFVTQTMDNGYTNEFCHNLIMHKNDEGLFEINDASFFPANDYLYLDDAETIRNPHYQNPNNIDDENYFGNNYHFTMEISAQFEYTPGQTFYFRGDDDVWVFIDSQLVVDLGGIHGPLEGSVDLDTLGLVEGNTYNFKLFFAERNCCGSNFRMVTSLNLRTNSTLFYERDVRADGVRYDIYQKRSQGNYACGQDEIIDTVEAQVDFYLSGPLLETPQLLPPGPSYGGILVSDELGSVTIDTNAIVGLDAGEYRINYYFREDPTQSGVITFIVPMRRVPNPVRTAAFFSDNGYGRVDRAEVYFQDPLDAPPDSMILCWSSLHVRNVQSIHMVLDSTDSTHVSVYLPEPFPEGLTTASDTSFGISFINGAFNSGLEQQHFTINDSVGPLLTEAILLERRSAGSDTLLLRFSELVSEVSVMGTTLRLTKPDGTPLDLDVAAYFKRSDTIGVIVDNTADMFPQQGDSLSIIATGSLRDMVRNRAHPDNRPVPIQLRTRPPIAQYGWYDDADADGHIDQAVIQFDVPPDLQQINLILSRGTAQSERIAPQNITYTTDSSRIIVSATGLFPAASDVSTEAVMQYMLSFDNFEDSLQSDYLSDSAAPVIASALFLPSPVRTGDFRDTLQIRFSEAIDEINYATPFVFHKRNQTTYAMNLQFLERENGYTYRYLVESMGGQYPSETDSVNIDILAGVGDLQDNIQQNVSNRKVPLQIRPLPVEYKVFIGPNPFDPLMQTIKFYVIPLLEAPELINYTVEIRVYDALGHLLYESFHHNDASQAIETIIEWNGTNLRGRIVGSGSYQLVLRIDDLKRNKTETHKFVVGVRR